MADNTSSIAAAAGLDSDDEADAGGVRSPVYSIGELAREFGVTLRTLRYYEDKGLLNPRRAGPNRLYGRRDRARLQQILMGKRVGFSLAQIRAMLELYELRDGQVGQLRTALSRFEEQIAHLEAQKDDIEQALAALRRTREVVAGLLRAKEQRQAVAG